MDRIGEYQVRRLIGEGGMGKVFEAEERLSGRRVALKVLRPELARSEEARRLFTNEMTILAQLDHPHVVRSLACSEVDGQLVMALEFLDGKTLREVLVEKGAMPWAEAVRIAAQIASALAAAHRQSPSIVHRDLKPENIMILPDGSVKVMDFGIAKVLQAASATTTHSVGTLQYMSPEQIDATRVDGRSDLYCLGLILYEMLAGGAPFQSASPRELLNLQCTAAPPALPAPVRAGLPRGVERLLFELLEKPPERRPASAEDVLHELEPFAPADERVVTERDGGIGSGGSSRARSSTPSASSERASERKPSAPAPVHSSPADSDKTKPSHAEIDLRRAAAPRNDTMALVERAAAPRELSPRVGIAVVLGLSLLAGAVTYWVRVSSSALPDTPAPTATRFPEARP
ncbi:MAG TPA: protein kinase [Polyangiaceae bacterium]|nr:protein kinase [Polyangiaceae bacterium]